MSGGVRGRALVVDDDRGTRTLCRTLLVRAGFDVVCVEDGEQAVETLAATTYDVVLLDLMMPRLDGIEVLGWLQRERPTLLGNIVVTTAANDRVVRSLPASGAVGAVIRKPFDITELVNTAVRCAATKAVSI